MTRFVFSFFTSITFLSYHSRAQTDTSTLKLNEVTVSSTYFAEDTSPLTFQNLTSRDLNTKSYGQEPSFILSATPSMTVYSDAGSYQGYSYFRLRGIDQTRLNMTLDGVPLNEPEDQGVYFSNYPDFLNSVSGVQIQRGVGTSKNGNASYGGSLLFSSPNLYDSSFSAFGSGYGSYNSYRIFGETQQRIDNKAFYLRASLLHSDGFKNRSANTSGSIFYAGAIHVKKHMLKLTGFAGKQKNELAWLGISEEQLIENSRINANTDETDQFDQSLTQLQHIFNISDHFVMRSSIYYNYLDGNYDFDLNNFLGLTPTEEMFNYALQSHLAGAFSSLTYEVENLKGTVGVHANRYSREHIGSEKTLGQLYENTGYKNEISGYTKISYQINKLLLYSDLQYRSTNFDYTGSVNFEEIRWDFFNPKVGTSYQINEKINAYYSIGKTGREPTRNDIFGGSDDLLADNNGNPLLSIVDPEYVVDHELGIRLQSRNYSANLNLYYMNFDNEIVLNGQFGPNGLALNSNVDQSTRKGVELDLTYSLSENIRLTNNSSFNRSQIEQQSERFQPILTPKTIINQEVIYICDKFETGLSLRYQSASFIDFANENSIEQYVLLNWRASYQHNKYSLALFVNNLTNRRYFNNGYVDFDGTNKYFVQAPVNFYSSLIYSF